MKFAEVIGKEREKAKLLQLVQTDKFPHALMLLGPAGSGKRTLALALAQYMFCESPVGQDSCGACTACKQMQKLEYPDLLFTFPVINRSSTSDPSKSEVFLKGWRQMMLQHPYFSLFEWVQAMTVMPLTSDKKKKKGAAEGGDGEDGTGKVANKQANIFRGECAEIVRKMTLKSFYGKQKVLLLWLPEYLEKEGNSLLKIIEEPPQDTIFIFVAENSEDILPTILSRCQIIRIGAIDDEAIAEALISRVKGISREKAWELALSADGNFNTAMQLAAETEGDSYGNLFIDWMRSCYRRPGGVQRLKIVEVLAEMGREPQKHLLSYGLHFLREMLVHSISDSLPARLQGQELVSAKNLMRLLTPEKIGEIGALLSDCHYHVERNANSKVLFFYISMQIHRIMHRATNAVAAVG
jgi:DNA polymerase-3 subunit delta'